ncbi:alpha-N-arabinofuranosidase [Novosphingobium aquae]|uniref:non-reducing end alpha-L-arabinofuranosidase n=1 Tax=Novosphingobium aquae TaxID=3133435 RepID=A0ABU8SBQ8_9SPHN
MKMISGLAICLAAMGTFASEGRAEISTPASIVVHADKPGPTISRDIFGQFSEMLGNGVYGGIWVGKDSAIPNVRGIRSDVVAALRELRVPVVRWPGGCFADKYNWRHGIGPSAARTATVNMWGNVVEPNTFGTDEFMDFAGQIGAEAYININMGSGSPAEAADWLEYMTTDQPSTLGKLRAANGHPAPYKIKYLGVGNESYGCGGGMTADEYVTQYKRYATFAKNLNPAQNGPVKFIRSKDAMLEIAVGPDSEKTEYTDAVMKAWSQRPAYSWEIHGLSLHHYTGGAQGVLASPSSHFGEAEYAASLKNTLKMEELIRIHSAAMDKYDPEKKVGLMVDEWGLWAKPLDGTNFMFLRQQGTQRDALLAAINLNIFARHADRVRMTNIAQMVNVIHAMILTDGPRMLKTPTYHVYRMYVPFQDATSIPMELQGDDYRFGDFRTPLVDGIAARGKDGKIWLALVNLDPAKIADVTATIAGVAASRASGEVLSAAKVDAGNTFDNPAAVAPVATRVEFQSGKPIFRLPPLSVTVVRLEN